MNVELFAIKSSLIEAQRVVDRNGMVEVVGVAGMPRDPTSALGEVHVVLEDLSRGCSLSGLEMAVDDDAQVARRSEGIETEPQVRDHQSQDTAGRQNFYGLVDKANKICHMFDRVAADDPVEAIVTNQVQVSLPRPHVVDRFYCVEVDAMALVLLLKLGLVLVIKYPNIPPIGLCGCLLYTSPSPRDRTRSRMPSSA